MNLFGPRRVRRHPRETPEKLADVFATFEQGPDGTWEEVVDEDMDVRLIVARALRYAAEKLEEEVGCEI